LLDWAPSRARRVARQQGQVPETWGEHFGNYRGTRDKGAALQAWLYHLLGGESSGHEAPTS